MMPYLYWVEYWRCVSDALNLVHMHPLLIDQAIAELKRDGYVDDFSMAAHWCGWQFPTDLMQPAEPF